MPFYLWRLERGRSDWATNALGESRDGRAVEPLVAILEDDKAEWWQKTSAAEALGKIGGDRAASALIATMKNMSLRGGVRRAAADALEAADAVPRTPTEDFVWYLSVTDGDKLPFLGPVAAKPLIDMIEHPDFVVEYYAPERADLVEVLGETRDPRAVKPLIDLLEHGDWFFRRHVATALAQIGTHKAVESLAAALEDKNEDQASGVLWALWLAPTSADYGPVVEPLIPLLKSEDNNIRNWAANALGRSRDPRAVAPLLAAIRNPLTTLEDQRVATRIESDGPSGGRTLTLDEVNESLRRDMIEAIGQIGGDEAVDALLTLLKDENPDIRHRAVHALCETEDPRAVEPLIALLRDKNEPGSPLRRLCAIAVQ